MALSWTCHPLPLCIFNLLSLSSLYSLYARASPCCAQRVSKEAARDTAAYHKQAHRNRCGHTKRKSPSHTHTHTHLAHGRVTLHVSPTHHHLIMPPKRALKKADRTAATGKRKTLSFAESTVKAAAAALQTTHVDAPVKAAVRRVPPTAAPRKKKQNAKKTTGTTSSASKKRAAGDLKRSGIVKAKKAEEEATALPVPSDEENSSDDEDDMLNGSAAVDSDADDLSDMANRSTSDDEDADLGPSKRVSSSASRERESNTVEPYRVVRLSFLPPEFQEPQLYKFLNQFGATVRNCFCVRSKRSHRSRGVAYVEFDKESVIPIVVEECNGMALGGKAVRARAVTMRRRMPSRQMVSRRRALAYAYKTKGTPLKKHDLRRKDPVGLLIKAVRTEKENNCYLKSLGIDFETDFFKSQLATLPPGLLMKKRSRSKKSENGAVAAAGVAKVVVSTIDTATAAPKSRQRQAASKAPAPKATGKKTK
ncbi:RNA-binding protein-like protein [Leishmania tarentolae]|uniref:RNA-binding protein-like protein n=1 Tax=Leishmania tarentolae TaxID=5689 RepID=A0A640KAA0_LEITA|nr:RNA-binding protein-like protein [Leishmania tarentolae]